jgi:hypothetical protein
MPQQEWFFDKEQNGHSVQVIKSYDAGFAKDAFRAMDSVLAFLGRSFDLQNKYKASGPPQSSDPNYADLLWDEMEKEAREDWKTFSYFVVLSDKTPLFVSPDWPTAEPFVQNTLCETTV